MDPSSVLEREFKFELPLGLPLPDLRDVIAQTTRLPETSFQTVYFDTGDLRLWHQGLTLRHRRPDDAEDGVWTLKLPEPSGGPQLERTELSWSGSDRTVPSEAHVLVAGLLRREPLRRVVTLETKRQRLTLSTERGTGADVVAEIDDDVVAVIGGSRDGVRFRQLELELRSERWKYSKVIKRLVDAGLRIESTTKLAKALALSDGPAEAPPVETATLEDVVLRSLRSGFEQLIEHDWRIRVESPAPSQRDVHKSRVATRRLRSDLKTFGAILDPVWLRHTLTELGWYGEVLGRIRDLDVLAQELIDATPPFRQRLGVQRREEVEHLGECLSSDRYLNLLDRLHASAARLPLRAGSLEDARRAAADSLPALVGARWRAVQREVKRVGSTPSPGELHRIRIKSKRLRYAAEAATPIIGGPARRTASAAGRLQTVLGEHHDAVARETWLRREWGQDDCVSTSAAAAFSAGLLAQEARQRQHELERLWEKELHGLRSSKVRAWLR
jgi:CHAD domain-containing protein